MLEITGSSHRFCDGISRRNFLQIGAFGAGITLADVLRARAASSSVNPAAGTTGRPKSAIMIYLPGGPSHIDMYDLKPNAPAEFRGEFKPIATNVSGIQISEHFPMQAKMMDKLAIIRSLVSVDEHSDSLVTTGYPERVNMTAGHPSFGSIVSKIRSSQASSVPHFVSLRGMSRGTEPGYLGISHRPFTPSGQGQSNLRLANGVTAERLEARKQLLTGFDDLRRDLDQSGTMSGLDTFGQKAIEMVTSGVVRKALDLTQEDAATRERYKGVEQFLTARRLVEAGVGCITLSIGGWDTHGQNFTTLKRQLPQLDRAIANLINDLHDRGLANDVVTVVWGEFGRTPKINSGAGRDHWSPVMSAMIAGGGLKMGQAIGSSTERAERPKDNPYTVPQVLATIYRAMGIDPAMTFMNGAGRPMYILDDREPVRELI
ncbi:DUF1501 domain-containing protein [Tuwongella immobilis]|uniref:DUF1501 domain-containing protein n=1 Tax=Tuwongella immobilis TaxID=692036 RepID=A0A6C2YVE4_9BACT|nr:DUF1501 domain-containing protein [Tuwongella immobilis]VIP05718.1 hypothetical protein : Putative uncharacterized protein OS=uncultured Acidobacteria bacterium A2 PE=4 SV=1: DUF1501 [Tuwongella immobilis]VTS08792.1 hypothetical protein : Putative uncharacterized protein OS=uncultured Acidobacteria bacterium A2 PE=4 SV=1: DUF1501 [Tuwongella immobilis]